MAVARPTFDLLVLGAGPAGLTAALAAARRGWSVEVVEAADRVGGMAASIDVGGVRVDLGSHRLHPVARPDVAALVRDVLGDDLQVRPRAGRIRLCGRWIAFPLRTVDVVRRLPPRVALGAAVDAAVSPLRRARSDTFGEVVQAGLGPTVTDVFYRPYAQKLWGLDADELDGSLARRRVATRAPTDVVRRLARSARPEGRTFWYPRLGFGQLAEALADEVRRAGGRIRLGAPVERLAATGDGWDAVLGGQGGGDRRRATVVLSTIPVTRLAAIAEPAPPPSVARAASRLTHRAMALVYLVLDQPCYTPFDAHYFPGADTVLSRLSEPKNYRDGPDPAARTVLCAELPCTAGDDLWCSDDGPLATRVGAELVAQGLPVASVVDHRVVRLPHVYPVLDRSAPSALAPLERWLAGRPNLLSLGRQGSFVPDNTHHVLAMALDAVGCLGGRDGRLAVDRAAWDRARRAFADHVVED